MKFPSGRTLVIAIVVLLVLSIVIGWVALAQAQSVGGELPDDGGPTGRGSSSSSSSFADGGSSSGSGEQVQSLALYWVGAR